MLPNLAQVLELEEDCTIPAPQYVFGASFLNADADADDVTFGDAVTLIEA